MLGKKPSTVNFDSLLEAKINLEKLANLYTGEAKESVGADKVASQARLILGKVKPSRIGRAVAKKQTDFSHLAKNKRVDTSESAVTRAAKEFGLPEFWTKAR